MYPMTTVEQATKTLTDFVKENRHGAHVDQVLEDEQDYFAQLALDDPDGAWLVGWAFLFVSKATGRLWEGSPGEVLEKINSMVPTTASQP